MPNTAEFKWINDTRILATYLGNLSGAALAVVGLELTYESPVTVARRIGAIGLQVNITHRYTYSVYTQQHKAQEV